MTATMTMTAAVAGLLALTGCAGAAASHPRRVAAADTIVVPSPAATRAQPVDATPPKQPRVQPPVAPPSCPGGPSVHFDTPVAAMTYLASAWNRNDMAELCQVTNPNARFLLNDMHREAVNLRLAKCQPSGVGEFTCTFRHDYPARMHAVGTGHAYVVVAAARNPGYYMSNFVGCG